MLPQQTEDTLTSLYIWPPRANVGLLEYYGYVHYEQWDCWVAQAPKDIIFDIAIADTIGLGPWGLN